MFSTLQSGRFLDTIINFDGGIIHQHIVTLRLLAPIIVAAGIFLSSPSLEAAPDPLNVKCGAELNRALSTAGAKYRISIVTNDSDSLGVHYLAGQVINQNNKLEGELTEFFSDRIDVQPVASGSIANQDPGQSITQPFSARQTGKTFVTISHPKIITIKWDGGGTTTNNFTCAPTNTLIWHDASYSAIMTLRSVRP